MDAYMQNIEQRVWQRITDQPVPEREDLRQVLYLAMEQAAAFRRLESSLTGKAQQLAKQLHGEGTRSVAVLRGIRRLSGTAAAEPREIPAPKMLPAALTEQCFRRSGRLLTEYASRALDPEFGTVWQVLADRERAAAARLAELAGMKER